MLANNTGWKGTKTNAELTELFIREARKPVDYALGANSNKRSYLVGFGNKRFAGPDHNDLSVCGKENRPYLPLADGTARDSFYKFPNRDQPVRAERSVFNPADQPIQDVMDSQFNEVALDYNAGFTANLAWLRAPLTAAQKNRCRTLLSRQKTSATNRSIS